MCAPLCVHLWCLIWLATVLHKRGLPEGPSLLWPVKRARHADRRPGLPGGMHGSIEAMLLMQMYHTAESLVTNESSGGSMMRIWCTLQSKLGQACNTFRSRSRLRHAVISGLDVQLTLHLRARAVSGHTLSAAARLAAQPPSHSHLHARSSSRQLDRHQPLLLRRCGAG